MSESIKEAFKRLGIGGAYDEFREFADALERSRNEQAQNRREINALMAWRQSSSQELDRLKFAQNHTQAVAESAAEQVTELAEKVEQVKQCLDSDSSSMTLATLCQRVVALETALQVKAEAYKVEPKLWYRPDADTARLIEYTKRVNDVFCEHEQANRRPVKENPRAGLAVMNDHQLQDEVCKVLSAVLDHWEGDDSGLRNYGEIRTKDLLAEVQRRHNERNAKVKA